MICTAGLLLITCKNMNNKKELENKKFITGLTARMKKLNFIAIELETFWFLSYKLKVNKLKFQYISNPSYLLKIDDAKYITVACYQELGMK